MSGEPIPDYGSGYRFTSELEAWRYAFANRIDMTQGAPRRSTLFRRIADTLLPGCFEWHEWTNRIIDALCEPGSSGLIGAPGCSNSCKTYNIVNFSVVWWLCQPTHSSVTLVSTTVKSLRRRGWAEVQKAYEKLNWDFLKGNFVDSRLIWQAIKGNDKNALIGRAVEEGSLPKVADDIKGVHTRRQMVIIDEATSVPDAIYEAAANLFSYPTEFIMVCIGNPRSRLDAFGRFCEPSAGWTSVSVDTDEWEAKPFQPCGGRKPTVIRFDAEKSPNIVEDRIVSRHLPRKIEVTNARNFSGGQSPHYWMNFRGFWAPEGLVKTVFTESAIVKFNGFGKHQFDGNSFQIIGAFDPAYGGDRACLRFAKLGTLTVETDPMNPMSSTWGIELLPPIILPINPHSKNPVHYQLAEQLRRECEKVTTAPGIYDSCPPENLGVDDSGEGGLCDILYRTWSPRIIRIEFGSAASEEPCSLEDIRPACEVYRNKRAEMFFRARGVLDSGQLKGIDQETAIELTTLEFDDSKERIVLTSKKDYKTKFNKSPDLADTVAMLIEVARRKGFRIAAIGETAKTIQQSSEVFAAQQIMFENADYSEEEFETETPI
jgi:hypothetical protein